MPVRKEIEPMTKVTLNLYTQDIARMKELYPTFRYQVAIRKLIRSHVSRTDKAIAVASEELADEIELEDEDV